MLNHKHFNKQILLIIVYFILITSIFTCPSGKFRCKSQVCVDNPKDCPILSCPINIPFKCHNGACVQDESFCDLLNGCPFNKPYKSKRGTCFINQSDSDKEDDFICKNENYKKCPDGSCIEKSEDCPQNNGCPLNMKKCADGSCVFEKEVCSIVVCPYEYPFKCRNGECRKIQSECEDLLKPEAGFIYCDNIFKGKNYFLCGDGTCAPSTDHCKPLIACPANWVMCDSLICKPTYNHCPEFSKNCPSDRPIRCNTGKCEVKEANCNALICKENEFYCPKTNTCALSSVKCDMTLQIDSCVISNKSCDNIQISSHHDLNIKFKLSSNSTEFIGKLHVAANIYSTLSNRINNQIGSLTIKQITNEEINSIKFNNTNTSYIDLVKVIPETDGILTYNSSILSTPFHIHIDFNGRASNLDFNGTFEIKNRELEESVRSPFLSKNTAFDNSTMTSKEESIPVVYKRLITPNDYCLAAYNQTSNYFECIDRKIKYNQNEYRINKVGLYAVILNPERSSIKGDSNFVINNFFLVFGIFIGLMIFVALIFFIITKVLRFREKYQDTKKRVDNLKNQLLEFKEMTTDVIGQTLRDNLEGIIFTKNPYHQIGSNSGTNSYLSEKESRVEDLEKKCKFLIALFKSKEEEMKMKEKLLDELNKGL